MLGKTGQVIFANIRDSKVSVNGESYTYIEGEYVSQELKYDVYKGKPNHKLLIRMTDGESRYILSVSAESLAGRDISRALTNAKSGDTIRFHPYLSGEQWTRISVRVNGIKTKGNNPDGNNPDGNIPDGNNPDDWRGNV